jgi:membrane protease YdiL (CAAX protease family)
MVVSNVLISVVFSGGGAANEDGVQNMISAFPSLMILSAGILAPWNEELIFRKTVKDLFKNKWLYVIVSGLLFGLAHVVGQVFYTPNQNRVVLSANLVHEHFVI